MENVCPNCGGDLIGDGYTSVTHCENIDPPLDAEPDSDVLYCDTEEVTHGRTPVIDLDQESWSQIKLAAKESNWIPEEYYMGDWVADVCRFLREGERTHG